ncbi:MAG: glycosyltransferase family 4 protein [Bacteroidales bacterium]|nr:glycosyltransferase family 4 protein [Bacteroidales bacterium]
MKKYRILIDLDRLKDPYNGLGQVAINLGEQLSRIEDDQIDFTFLVPGSFIGKFGDKVRYEKVSLKRRLFPWLCASYDLWYTIHQDSWYFPSSARTPYVMTINDLNFLGEKKGINRKYRLKRLQVKVNHAKIVTAISSFTASEIRKYLKVEKKEIRVIYCGVEVTKYTDTKKPAFVTSDDFLFTIGVIQSKKNFAVLVDFIKKLPDNYSLVIAGNKNSDYARDIEKQIIEKGLQGRIILPGFISDEEKSWLYQHCKAVVFPSRFEGMGFPPIEAMRNGKPVFASTYSSIPEVCGEYAYYWQHFEPSYMADTFLEGMRDFVNRPEREEQLKQHSMQYDWEQVTDRYISLFKEVLNGKT